MAPPCGAPFQKAALLGERRLLGDFDRRRLPVLAVRTEAVLGRILRDTRCRNHHRRVTRFRTKDGIVLTLTEEPLRTSFAEETNVARPAAGRIAPQAAAAQMPAAVVNSYRWSSGEQGRAYTLTGLMSITELEAAAKRLSELERLP